MAESDDFFRKCFICGILTEKALDRPDVYNLAQRLLFSEDNWIQGFAADVIRSNKTTVDEISIFRLINSKDDLWLEHKINPSSSYSFSAIFPKRRVN